MIEIDGAQGEGGGQVLRTSLTLAALTGQAMRIHSVRAGRSQPGLRPQHLSAALALGQVCRARLRGAYAGSAELLFEPTRPPLAGEYRVDVAEAAGRGSAGSVTLILQAMALPLAFGGGPSRVVLAGGTHVPWSPPFHYLQNIFQPAARLLGLEMDAQLEAWGWYPAGGGRVAADIGSCGQLRAADFVQRGPLRRVRGLAVACNLPADIAQRMANRARNVLQRERLPAEVAPERVSGPSPGAAIFLTAEYGSGAAGFSALGERGKPADKVADEACHALLEHQRSDQALDPHLADQLLLPMALAAGESEMTVSRVTSHLLTNAEVIRRFVPAGIEVMGGEGESGRVRVTGVGHKG